MRVGDGNKTKNYTHEEIKSRLDSEISCYRSSQNALPSYLLSETLEIKIYKNIILFVVLYWCKTWSLILKEQC
jgi:hypothetical protein